MGELAADPAGHRDVQAIGAQHDVIDVPKFWFEPAHFLARIGVPPADLAERGAGQQTPVAVNPNRGQVAERVILRWPVGQRTSSELEGCMTSKKASSLLLRSRTSCNIVAVRLVNLAKP